MEDLTNYLESGSVHIKDKRIPWLFLGLGIISLAIIALFLLFFLKPTNESGVSYVPKTIAGELRLAFINSDTLWAHYEFVKDKKDELAMLENKYQGQYDYLRKKFEEEYQAYVKKGTAGQLSLAQQKEAEAQLGEQQKHLMTLDEELSTRFVEQKSQMNQMLLDTIINYVHRYNKNVGYDFILEYSKISGIFYANDSLDITESILNGLNFEYRKWK